MDMTGNKEVTYFYLFFFAMLLDCKIMWHLENHKEGNLKPQKLLYFGGETRFGCLAEHFIQDG